MLASGQIISDQRSVQIPPLGWNTLPAKTTDCIKHVMRESTDVERLLDAT
jgi:imidazoleglycerol phosphate synthase glutamine amidotransferase subunit HisH